MLISPAQYNIKNDFVEGFNKNANCYLNEWNKVIVDFEEFADGKNNGENEGFRSELLCGYVNAFSNSYNEFVFNDENGAKNNDGKIGDLKTDAESIKRALNLDWYGDVENRSYQMNSHKKSLTSIDSNNIINKCSPLSDRQDNPHLDSGNGVHFKMNSVSHFGYPTTSKSILKMHMPTDDDTNFDVFDFNMRSDDDFQNSGRHFEKDAFSINGDLMDDYENRLGLDIVKDKNVCWAAGNIDNEICPLRSYGCSNDNSLLSFTKDNLDSESRDSFSHGWDFDDNIEQVSQDHSLIVPKKTGDITKIKGWRKKQFTSDKHSVNKTDSKFGNSKELKAIESCNEKNEETNKAFAFVCDELDDFLDQEAELNISYEIPHLSAEYGIKLTREELVSRPKSIPDNEPVQSKRLSRKCKNVNLLKLLSQKEVRKSPPTQTKSSRTVHTNVKAKSALNKYCKSDRQIKFKPIAKEHESVRRRTIKDSITSTTNDVLDRIDCKFDPNGLLTEAYESKVIESLYSSKDYKYTMRTLGLVIYPGPMAPLHEYLMSHLDKIRSYRTDIDSMWANFALSALAVKGELVNRKRMILPLKCIVKYKPDDAKTVRKTEKIIAKEVEPDAKVIKELVSDIVDKVCTAREKAETKEKKCKTVFLTDDTTDREACDIEMNDSENVCEPEFSVNELKVNPVYSAPEFVDVNCVEGVKSDLDDECSVIFDSKHDGSIHLPEVTCIDDQNNEKVKSNKKKSALIEVIAKLLTKKLNELRTTKNTNCGIDKLRTITPNTLELIKLNFIKENFVIGYINLWYIRFDTDQRPKRMFLTFTAEPPFENAINLKSIPRYNLANMPNIVVDFLSVGNSFSNDDYAILYCDGKDWEMHGSVNFAFNKSPEVPCDEKRQLFHIRTVEIPELNLLEVIKRRDERSRILKWWVLQMTQDFSEVNITYRGEVGRISRAVILKTWRSNVPSFIEFKGFDKVRNLGIAINPSLWPYSLIGPYFVNDQHGLTLKLHGINIPFEYSLPLDRIDQSYVLKRFISSVVMHSWRSHKRVIGIWLYDRVGTKQNSFMEVMTRMKKTGNYEPSTEHDYSLTQTEDGLTETKFDSPENFNRIMEEEDNTESSQVALIPDVPKLGYIEGEYRRGNIIINHPLKPNKKVVLRDVDKELNSLLKKRLIYIPESYSVRWKVVSRSLPFESMKPFNKYILGGMHVLCSKGVFYLLSLTKGIIKKLGLSMYEKDIVKALDENPLIQEIVALKELGKTLSESRECGLGMDKILSMAVNEIKLLENQSKDLQVLKELAEKEREDLCRKISEILCNCQDDKFKPIWDYINRVLRKDVKDDVECSELCPSERSNFMYLDSLGSFLSFITTKKDTHITPAVTSSSSSVPQKRKRKWKGRRGKRRLRDPGKVKTESAAAAAKTVEPEVKKVVDSELVKKLEMKIDTLYEILEHTNVDDSMYQELNDRLNVMSEQLKKIKSIYGSQTAKSDVAAVGNDGIEVCEEKKSESVANGIVDGEKNAEDNGVVSRSACDKNDVKNKLEVKRASLDSEPEIVEIVEDDDTNLGSRNGEKS